MLLRRPGFTLVETLLYTLFVAMIMISMTLLAYTSFSVKSELRSSLVLQENLRFAAGRISFLVSEASGITTPPLGTTSGTLILTMPTATSSPTTITTTGGTVFLTQGTGTAMALTSNEISLSSLTFTRVSSTSAIVRIVAAGSSRNAAASYTTLTVTTTAAVRR